MAGEYFLLHLSGFFFPRWKTQVLDKASQLWSYCVPKLESDNQFKSMTMWSNFILSGIFQYWFRMTDTRNMDRKKLYMRTLGVFFEEKLCSKHNRSRDFLILPCAYQLWFRALYVNYVTFSISYFNTVQVIYTSTSCCTF